MPPKSLPKPKTSAFKTSVHSPPEKTPPRTYAEVLPSPILFAQSDSIRSLITALNGFQSEAPIITHDKTGYGYTYATLANCIETAQPLIKKHKLAVSQFPCSSGDRVGIVTILSHVSGEWMRCACTFKIPQIQSANDAQNAGAVITYARRYAFCAVLGLVAEEDTDAA